MDLIFHWACLIKRKTQQTNHCINPGMLLNSAQTPEQAGSHMGPFSLHSRQRGISVPSTRGTLALALSFWNITWVNKQASRGTSSFSQGKHQKHFVNRNCPRQMKKSSTLRAREEVGDKWRYCHMGTSNTCLSKNFSYLYNFQKSHFQLLTFHQLPVSQILSFCVLLLKGLKASGGGQGYRKDFLMLCDQQASK